MKAKENKKEKKLPATDRISRILSIIAVCVSIVLPTISFYCTRYDIKKSREEHVELTAQLDLSNVWVGEPSRFCKLSLIDTNIRDGGLGGLYLYVAASVSNLGEMPITLSSLISYFQTEDFRLLDSYSNACFEKDFITPTYLPIIVEPHVVKKVLIRVPWCIPQTDSVIVSILKPDSLYSGEQYVENLEIANVAHYATGSPIERMVGLFWGYYRDCVASGRDTLDIVVKANFASGSEIIRKIQIRPSMDKNVIPRGH